MDLVRQLSTLASGAAEILETLERAQLAALGASPHDLSGLRAVTRIEASASFLSALGGRPEAPYEHYMITATWRRPSKGDRWTREDVPRDVYGVTISAAPERES